MVSKEIDVLNISQSKDIIYSQSNIGKVWDSINWFNPTIFFVYVPIQDLDFQRHNYVVVFLCVQRGLRGHDHMVVGLSTTYEISAYPH